MCKPLSGVPSVKRQEYSVLVRSMIRISCRFSDLPKNFAFTLLLQLCFPVPRQEQLGLDLELPHVFCLARGFHNTWPSKRFRYLCRSQTDEGKFQGKFYSWSSSASSWALFSGPHSSRKFFGKSRQPAMVQYFCWSSILIVSTFKSQLTSNWLCSQQRHGLELHVRWVIW